MILETLEGGRAVSTLPEDLRLVAIEARAVRDTREPSVTLAGEEFCCGTLIGDSVILYSPSRAELAGDLSGGLFRMRFKNPIRMGRIRAPFKNFGKRLRLNNIGKRLNKFTSRIGQGAEKFFKKAGEGIMDAAGQLAELNPGAEGAQELQEQEQQSYEPAPPEQDMVADPQGEDTVPVETLEGDHLGFLDISQLANMIPGGGPGGGLLSQGAAAAGTAFLGPAGGIIGSRVGQLAERRLQRRTQRRQQRRTRRQAAQRMLVQRLAPQAAPLLERIQRPAPARVPQPEPQYVEIERPANVSERGEQTPTGGLPGWVLPAAGITTAALLIGALMLGRSNSNKG